MLRVILNDKNMSLYQLEKTSHISHATLNDIYNEKSNIYNCSISVMSKIATSLDMSLDELFNKLTYNDLSLFRYNEDFDLFKSNTLQRLKKEKKNSFINRIVSENMIDNYYQKQEYTKALYLLSLVDYLSTKSNEPYLEKYDYLRDFKLNKLYVSKSIYLLLKMKHLTVTDIFKDCPRDFLKHNIVEAEIENVIQFFQERIRQYL